MKSATFRYRVGRIVHVVEPLDLADGKRMEPSVFAEDIREFRTTRQARAYQAKLKGTTFLQFGVLEWVSAEEASKRLDELQHEGFHLE